MFRLAAPTQGTTSLHSHLPEVEDAYAHMVVIAQPTVKWAEYAVNQMTLRKHSDKMNQIIKLVTDQKEQIDALQVHLVQQMDENNKIMCVTAASNIEHHIVEDAPSVPCCVHLFRHAMRVPPSYCPLQRESTEHAEL
ncbi:hypothetical protein M8J77_015329 [Diaphorina citri]|nr:hypothetical protein M8J77_015329 [Diaphorina citri]